MGAARWKLFAAVMLSVTLWTPANAQAFDVSAGMSTLYGAEGASVVIHGETQETEIGAGLINGHLGMSAASTARLHKGLLTTGQQHLSMELPTDIFGGGQMLSGTGVGFSSAPGAGSGFRAFAGASSAESGTPLFASISLNSPAAYLQWKQPLFSSFTDSLHLLSTALFSPRTGGAVLESLSWAPSHKVVYAVTAGVGDGDPYGAASFLFKGRKLDLKASYVLAGERFERGTDPELASSEPIRENASAEYHLTRSVAISGMHRNYLTPGVTAEGAAGAASLASAVRSSLDEIGMDYHRSTTVLRFNLLHSHSQEQSSVPATAAGSSGISFGFTRKLNSLDWSENFYESLQADHSHTALLVNGLAVNLNPHLRLTESVNVTANGPTFSHGGALLTSFSSFEVDYQLLYLATRADNPFQQAMVFDSRIRLVRDLWLQASSSISPTGSILYTFRVGKEFTRTAAGPAPVPAASFGDNILRGRVVDPQGVPIDGAAILIDSTLVYTDPKGMFFFREKTSHAHPLNVSTDDFMQVGAYAVVSAPKLIRTSPEQSAQPITIVVSRVADTSSTAGRRPITPLRNELR